MVVIIGARVGEEKKLSRDQSVVVGTVTVEIIVA